jgi:hypothetical protein
MGTVEHEPPQAMNHRTFLQSSLAGVAFAALPDSVRAAGRNRDLDRLNPPSRRTGRVRLDELKCSQQSRSDHRYHESQSIPQ